MTSNQWITRNGRTSKRGLFVSGIWHCDCDPRLPAEKFQVKNGGKHHGRWFFTCQQPQPKRCGFFLWRDDAKVREEAAVLNNSRNEPGANEPKLGPGGRLRSEQEIPRTPKRQTKINEPITPLSKQKSPTMQGRSPRAGERHDESFDWSSSAEEDLMEFAQHLDYLSAELEDDESPRKSVKTSTFDSPSKRAYSDVSKGSDQPICDSQATVRASSPAGGDVFQPPSTSVNPPKTGLLSPGETPRNLRRQLFPLSSDFKRLPNQDETIHEPTSLALDALSILSPVRSSISPETEKALVSLLTKHELRALGIEKGRDIARAALQIKEKRITELQQRLAALEAEREVNRTVIQHLKTDIATSPKKPRRPGQNYKSDNG